MDYPFVSREVEIYFPYPEEFPDQLLSTVGLTADECLALKSEPLVRVAKHREQVVGAYATLKRGPDSYEVVAVVVVDEVQNRGLGRWLLGHAIGVAEAKGGRTVYVTDTRLQSARNAVICEHVLTRSGFARQEERWCLNVTPE